MGATAHETLTYRPFRDSDLPAVLQLWGEHSGWGELTPDKWRAWYAELPHGPCLIMVAADGAGDVVAQLVFTPARVAVGGREVRALRLSAPVLRSDLRSGGAGAASGRHVIIDLFAAGAEAARAGGYSLVYAYTQHAWLALFRAAPRLGLPRFADAVARCAELPLDRPAPAAPRAGLTAAPVVGFDGRFAALWAAARENFPIACGVVRSPDWVRYKNRGHLTLEARDRWGALAGYAAVHRRTGLLVDVLARDPDELSGVVRAAAGWLSSPDGAASRGAVTRLKVMAAPALGPVLDELPFEPADYRFAFVCASLDADVPLDEVAPARWYTTPGD